MPSCSWPSKQSLLPHDQQCIACLSRACPACRHLPLDYMLGKAEGQTRPHQPGAPMDHSPASSAKPLEPFRRLILRSHFPGAASSHDAGPTSPPSSFEADRRSSHGSLEGQISGSHSEPASSGLESGSCRIGVGEWLRGHLKPGAAFPPLSPLLSSPITSGRTLLFMCVKMCKNNTASSFSREQAGQ